MRIPDICLCENKGADQLRSYWEADLRLCFHYSDRTISLLPKSEISSFRPGWKPRIQFFSLHSSKDLPGQSTCLFLIKQLSPVFFFFFFFFFFFYIYFRVTVAPSKHDWKIIAWKVKLVSFYILASSLYLQ